MCNPLVTYLHDIQYGYSMTSSTDTGSIGPAKRAVSSEEQKSGEHAETQLVQIHMMGGLVIPLRGAITVHMAKPN